MPGSDQDGNLLFGGVGLVTTRLENDKKVMLKCMGSDITNLSGRGQNFSGFSCAILVDGGVVVTHDTHATVTPSEVGTMTCTFDKDDL
jgi:hypothetical protein